MKKVLEYSPSHTIIFGVILSIDKGIIFDTALHLLLPLREYMLLSYGLASVKLRLSFGYPGLGNMGTDMQDVLDKELFRCILMLDDANKKSVLEMLKTFLKNRKARDINIE